MSAAQMTKESLIADRAERGYALVEVDVWVHADDYATTGHVVRSRWKSVDEVRNELLAHLPTSEDKPDWWMRNDWAAAHEYGMEDVTNFAQMMAGRPSEPVLWPAGRICVFSVRGGSEGDWVHVEVQDEVQDPDGYKPATCVLLAKTFKGRDAAWRFARVLADLLGC